MVRQTTKVILVEVLGALSLLLMTVLAVFAITLSSGPVDIDFFEDDIEGVLTQSRAGRAVGVEGLTLEWSPAQRRLFVVAREVSLKDTQGREAGHAARANLTLDAGSMLLGKVELLEVTLQDGWIALRHTPDNRWELAGDPLPTVAAGDLPTTPREWLDRTNGVLVSILSGLESLESSLTLEALRFEGMEVHYVSPDGGEVGRLEGASGALLRRERDLALSLTGMGGGVGLPGQFTIELATLDAFGAMRADIAVDAWPVPDLARRLGLTGFAEGGLTAAVTFGAGVTRSDGLQKVDIRVDRQDGTLSLPIEGETVSELNLDLTYLVDADAVQFNTVRIETDRFGGSFTGSLSNVLSENALRRLELLSPDLRLDLSRFFEAPWRFQDVEFSADLSDDFSIISFDRLKATANGVAAQAAGELDWTVEHLPSQVPVSLDLTAETLGDLDKATLLSFWPQLREDGARSFVKKRLLNGVASEATVALKLRPDSFSEGFLREGDLAINFTFRDGEVQFMDELPTVRNASGTGFLSGNTFKVNALQSDYDDWKMGPVEVDFPKLNPPGTGFSISATGAGPVVSAVRTITNFGLKPDQVAGFDAERLSGTAQADFFLARPGGEDVKFEDVTLKVNGTIAEAGLRKVFGDFDLTDGFARIDINQDDLIITGYGEIGQAPVQFTWRDGLVPDVEPADLSATAIINPDVLNGLGIIGRTYLMGEIPLEIQGKIGTTGLSRGSFAFDLREARIELDQIGWIKPAGEAARATLTYSGVGERQATTVRLESETAELDGDLLVGSSGRLERLTLRRLFILDQADINGTISRTAAQGLSLVVGGKFLDVSGFLGEIGTAGGGLPEIGAALRLDADVDRLRVRSGLELQDASLDLVTTARGLALLDAVGKTASGAGVSAAYRAAEPGGAPTISLQTEDAGFLAQALFDIDFISEGKLDLTGTLGTGTQPTRLLARIENARLLDAPFLTQILSLASLRGLTDTLSGDGVLFSQIEVPIAIGGGRYVFEGGRASGPALGLTVNGWIDTKGQGLDLNGVLVPSFGINSVLGGVPLIGDLFVGRQGEGVFSITYSVIGTLQKAQVSVNPLSAATPGILRRIFENPADTSIPKSLPIDPNLKPPLPKLPDLPDDQYIEPVPGGG